MSMNEVIPGARPAWMRFVDFQGPTPAEERQAVSLDNVRGKQFKRNQRDRGALRSQTRPDAAGQWGTSTHRTVFKTRF